MAADIVRTDSERELLRLAFTVCSRIGATLDRRLQSRHRISLAEFEVLDALRNGPAEGMRMTLLAETASISKSRLSHCVDRLCDHGYVRRHRVDVDRRGMKAALTANGWQIADEAAGTHRVVRREILADLFHPHEAELLLQRLRNISNRELDSSPNFR